MKRIGHLFERVAAFQNLLAAYERARSGKRGRPTVERFTRRLEPELFRLQEELTGGTYRPGDMVTFEIHDPKRRTISVAPFRDRVVHHALIAIVQPHLERGMDPDSYGCRLGKGTDGALARALVLVRRQPFALRCDVRQFFASVDHEVVLGQLGRLFKDRKLLALMEQFVRQGGRHGSAAGRGLPIGSLTSQWFANVYLTPLDRWFRRQPACRGMVRYMDDTLVAGSGQCELRALGVAANEFLRSELHVELKETVTQVHCTATGVPFLGLRVGRGGLEIRREAWRRLTRRIQRREWEYRQGRISQDTLRASVRSTLSHLDRARTRALRRRFLADHAPVEW